MHGQAWLPALLALLALAALARGDLLLLSSVRFQQHPPRWQLGWAVTVRVGTDEGRETRLQTTSAAGDGDIQVDFDPQAWATDTTVASVAGRPPRPANITVSAAGRAERSNVLDMRLGFDPTRRDILGSVRWAWLLAGPGASRYNFASATATAGDRGWPLEFARPDAVRDCELHCPTHPFDHGFPGGQWQLPYEDDPRAVTVRFDPGIMGARVSHAALLPDPGECARLRLASLDIPLCRDTQIRPVPSSVRAPQLTLDPDLREMGSAQPVVLLGMRYHNEDHALAMLWRPRQSCVTVAQAATSVPLVGEVTVLVVVYALLAVHHERSRGPRTVVGVLTVVCVLAAETVTGALTFQLVHAYWIWYDESWLVAASVLCLVAVGGWTLRWVHTRGRFPPRAAVLAALQLSLWGAAGVYVFCALLAVALLLFTAALCTAAPSHPRTVYLGMLVWTPGAVATSLALVQAMDHTGHAHLVTAGLIAGGHYVAVPLAHLTAVHGPSHIPVRLVDDLRAFTTDTVEWVGWLLPVASWFFLTRLLPVRSTPLVLVLVTAASTLLLYLRYRLRRAKRFRALVTVLGLVLQVMVTALAGGAFAIVATAIEQADSVRALATAVVSIAVLSVCAVSGSIVDKPQ
jgi:hypothetical protein